MMSREIRRIRSRAWLLCGASLAAGLWAMAAPSSADAAEAAPASGQAALAAAPGSVDEVVVTGTRVVRDGYSAPTPTSVVGAEEIAAKAPTNLADYVNTLPSLQGSSTPRTTISAISAGNGGINALNLRNLGLNRTLVLLDGQRVGASSVTGLIDINQFPQALVKRVEVVTGGASAGWGSDAVAGVVNFVLDHGYSGLKGEVQAGVTDYGDDASYKASVTAGTAVLGDRGHLLVSAEVAHSDGVSGIGSRRWYDATKVFNNPAYTATNGQPQLLVRPNSGFATATPGGIITNGPLRGTYFGAGGAPGTFDYGPVVSGNFMQGGAARYADFGTSGDLDPRTSRQNLFTRLSYEVAPRLQMFAQLSYGRATSHVAFGNQYNFGNLVIRADNAFLPASVAARAVALNVASFNLGTLNADLGLITTGTERESWRPVVGASGALEAFGRSWTWDAYAQRSRTDSYVESRVSNTARYTAAIDAVRDASGTIVCRSTLTAPANGCVPYDIFGVGVNGPAAVDYVMGKAWGRTRITEDVVAANLRGEPVSTWAGPVSVALGAEHRREAVSGSNDPLSPSRAYWAGNYVATHGAYTVTEGYLEAVAPLAKDQPFARSLDLNGAVRLTDYSTSGSVTTWKLGLTWSPVEDLALRATRSRDIRAPNLAELFQAAQTVTSTFPDPFRGNASATTFQVTSGNLALRPETADSYGVGVVVQPRWLGGFAASVDYYNIDIKDAIATVDAPTLVNQCYAGNTALCGQIVRNPAGVITTVLIHPINLSKQLARGLDIEASYRRPLWDGELSLRLLATRYLKNVSNNGINKPTDNVGQNNGRGSSAASLPEWSYTASAGWERGPLGLNLTARGFSAGVYDTAYVGCVAGCPASTATNPTIENNHLPSALYLDAHARYRFSERLEAYVSVDNLTNKDPATVGWATGGAPLSVNQALYDTLGRRYRVGLRFAL